MSAQYRFTDMEFEARKCKDLIYSTRKAIMDLHHRGGEVNNVLKLYLKIKKPLMEKQYRTALKFAEDAFDVACSELSSAGKEELKAGDVRKNNLNQGEYDFDISYKETSNRPGPEDNKNLEYWEMPDNEISFIMNDDNDNFFEIEIENTKVVGDEKTRPLIKSPGREEDFFGKDEYFIMDDRITHKKDSKNKKSKKSTKKSPKTKDTEKRDTKPKKIIKRKAKPDRKKNALKNKLTEYCNDQEFHKALKTINKILEKSIYEPELLIKKGSILFELGEYEHALEVIDSVLIDHPMNMDAWVEKGYLLHHVGDIVNSFYSFERAMALDPTNINVLTSIGALYYEGEEFHKAHMYFKRATEIDPEDANLWFYRGRAAEKQERWQESAMCYDRVLFIDPFHRDAILGRDECHRHIYNH